MTSTARSRGRCSRSTSRLGEARAGRLGGDRDRLEALQRLLQRSAAAVMEAVDRIFGLAEALGDLAGRVAGDMAKDDHVALDVGQFRQCRGQRLRQLAATILGALVDRTGLLAQ